MSLTGLLSCSYRAASFMGMTLNLGYLLDRSAQLSKSKLTPVQRFAAGISDVSQALVSVGVETDWQVGNGTRVGPFAELTGGFGLGARLRDDPIRATLGTKIQPLGASRLEVTLGADYALAGQPRATGTEMAGIAPWAIFARVGGPLTWMRCATLATTVASSCARDADCAQGLVCVAGACAVVKVERVVEGRATFAIVGRVTDQATQKPIDSAIITISGYESTPVAVNRQTGEYVSFPLPCGDGLVQLTAVADRFFEQKQTIPKAGDNEVRIVDFALRSTAQAPTAEVRGSLKDEANGESVQGTVFFPSLNVKIETDPDGHFRTSLAPGRYQILITAPRFFTQKKELEIRGGDNVILNVDLTARGK
jgi:hypothetical protein